MVFSPGYPELPDLCRGVFQSRHTLLCRRTAATGIRGPACLRLDPLEATKNGSSCQSLPAGADDPLLDCHRPGNTLRRFSLPAVHRCLAALCRRPHHLPEPGRAMDGGKEEDRKLAAVDRGEYYLCRHVHVQRPACHGRVLFYPPAHGICRMERMEEEFGV